jgi:signal transduction histidine kinase
MSYAKSDASAYLLRLFLNLFACALNVLTCATHGVAASIEETDESSDQQEKGKGFLVHVRTIVAAKRLRHRGRPGPRVAASPQRRGRASISISLEGGCVTARGQFVPSPVYALMLSEDLQNDVAAISRISAVPAILKFVAKLTGMRLTLIARVTPTTWTACAVHDRLEFGLRVGDQLELSTTLCKEVRDANQPVVIESVSTDPKYCNHETPKLYEFESYFSIPIVRPNGEFFGTLCGLDKTPRKLDSDVIEALSMYTEMIGRQVQFEDDVVELGKSLTEERKLSRLREEFIAVLGHDLRTPLGGIAAITAVIAELGREPVPPEMLKGLEESTKQMARLIDDVLDLARGRLGGGLLLARRQSIDLIGLTQEAIYELSRVHPGRVIRFNHRSAVTAEIDDVRFRQLLANVIGNALQHSPASEEVSVEIEEKSPVIRLTVTNGGDPLPQELMQDLFSPFNRAKTGPKRAGLGLGLYIASEIARAHGGSIHADSDASRTKFTVILPVSSTPRSASPGDPGVAGEAKPE